MTSTPGDANDHRPDVQQAVLALLVAHDGGVPVVSQRWEGHAAAPEMFQERAAALLATVQHAATPRSLVADATLDTDAHAAPAHTGLPRDHASAALGHMAAAG